MKDYREFQQIVIPVEGEQLLPMGSSGPEGLHEGDVIQRFESKEAVGVFIFDQLKVEFIKLRNREPNENEISAIREKVVGIIGDMVEEGSMEEEGSNEEDDKKIKEYNQKHGFHEESDDNDWEDVDDKGKVLDKKTKKQKFKS